MGETNLISVVTLSPAVDVTYKLKSLNLGEVNRVQEVLKSPGGKALNVARLLRKLEVVSALHVPLGGFAGKWIASELEHLGVNASITPIAAETRTAVTAFTGDTTVMNEPASEINANELKALKKSIPVSEIVVFSGSIPASVSIEQVRDLFQHLKTLAETLIIDTSGEALLVASEFADYLKPNLEELEQATGLSKKEGVKKLRASGAKLLLSLGEDGVELHSDEITHFKTPKQQGNPTGAGDALTTGFASKLHEGEKEACRFGCALSATSVRSDVAGDFDPAVLEQILEQVEEIP